MPPTAMWRHTSALTSVAPKCVRASTTAENISGNAAAAAAWLASLVHPLPPHELSIRADGHRARQRPVRRKTGLEICVRAARRVLGSRLAAVAARSQLLGRRAQLLHAARGLRCVAQYAGAGCAVGVASLLAPSDSHGHVLHSRCTVWNERLPGEHMQALARSSQEVCSGSYRPSRSVPVLLKISAQAECGLRKRVRFHGLRCALTKRT
jgi:hypothetical protein